MGVGSVPYMIFVPRANAAQQNYIKIYGRNVGGTDMKYFAQKSKPQKPKVTNGCLLVTFLVCSFAEMFLNFISAPPIWQAPLVVVSLVTIIWLLFRSKGKQSVDEYEG